MKPSFQNKLLTKYGVAASQQMYIEYVSKKIPFTFSTETTGEEVEPEMAYAAVAVLIKNGLVKNPNNGPIDSELKGNTLWVLLDFEEENGNEFTIRNIPANLTNTMKN